MKPARLRRLAVLGATAALAVPAVAQANEVTKWNEIAVNTINAQPPLTSAPPAGAVFVAMVQGAVYGAVNAVDHHGRPYLIDRSYPKASADAAAATAAFRVLDFFFSSTHHATLQAAYDASLLAIADGASKEQGIEVGGMAADAMIAEGHDSRWGDRAALRPDGVGGKREAVRAEQPLAVPHGGPLSARERRLCGGPRRGQVARKDRQRHTHCRPDPRGGVLADEPGGELQRHRAQARRPVLARRD
jgi:hypothetical protein